MRVKHSLYLNSTFLLLSSVSISFFIPFLKACNPILLSRSHYSVLVFFLFYTVRWPQALCMLNCNALPFSRWWVYRDLIVDGAVSCKANEHGCPPGAHGLSRMGTWKQFLCSRPISQNSIAYGSWGSGFKISHYASVKETISWLWYSTQMAVVTKPPAETGWTD